MRDLDRGHVTHGVRPGLRTTSRIAVTATSPAADRLTGTPSDDAVFFESKFERVRAPRDALVRARCTDVLRESAPRLVLLAAPPGFGKTTLLAQWREVDDRAFACVSLDSGDNDPVTFWSYIVQAIRHAVPEWGAAALGALREPRADVVDTVVPAVLSGPGRARREARPRARRLPGDHESHLS